ncbi:MAG: hypothetical protein QF496_01355 [Dehalococcoidia bacterium]|jgi:hypothetical protein|nr:hypothetical protein [Dehalococcoidia bacterium]|tara:strand:+ start:245 stop:454 length:210 start_codon:yes stop_codon:yes gene_type:complete
MNKRLILGIFLIIVGVIYLLILGDSFGQLLILSIGIYFCLIGLTIKLKESKNKKSEDQDNQIIENDSKK